MVMDLGLNNCFPVRCIASRSITYLNVNCKYQFPKQKTHCASSIVCWPPANTSTLFHPSHAAIHCAFSGALGVIHFHDEDSGSGGRQAYREERSQWTGPGFSAASGPSVPAGRLILERRGPRSSRTIHSRRPVSAQRRFLRDFETEFLLPARSDGHRSSSIWPIVGGNNSAAS